MEVNFSAYYPAELRLLSKFVSDLAEIREQQNPSGLPLTPLAPVANAQTKPETSADEPEKTEAKRTRKSKVEPSPTPADQPESRPSTPAGSDKPLTAGEAVEALRGHANEPDAGGDESPAATATEAAGSAPAPAAADPVTQDTLRQLMGEISQVSMSHRTAAIALVRSTAGCNGISDIKPEFLPAIHEGFQTILAEAKEQV